MTALDDFLAGLDLTYLSQARHKIKVAELFASPDNILLDIRTAEERQCVRFDFGAQVRLETIPLDHLPQSRQQLPQDRIIGIFCPQGVRAGMAFAYLQAWGYAGARVVEGGYAALCEQARPGNVPRQLAGLD